MERSSRSSSNSSDQYLPKWLMIDFYDLPEQLLTAAPAIVDGPAQKAPCTTRPLIPRQSA